MQFTQAHEFDDQLRREFEAEQIQLDRDWYDQEEFGQNVDENRNPFVGETMGGPGCVLKPRSSRRRAWLLHSSGVIQQ